MGMRGDSSQIDGSDGMGFESWDEVRVGVCVEVQLKSFVSEGMGDEVLKVWVLKFFHRGKLQGVSYQVSRCLKSLLYFNTAKRHREVLHCCDREIGDTNYMELQYGCKLNAAVKAITKVLSKSQGVAGESYWVNVGKPQQYHIVGSKVSISIVSGDGTGFFS